MSASAQSAIPQPKMYPHDHIMRYIVLPFVPKFVQPNHITIVRMLLTPMVVWLLFDRQYMIGVFAFAAVAFTDILDGSLARVRKQVTAWGIFFDPLADKLLVGSVALVVALQHFHPVVIFAAILLDLLPAARWASAQHTGTVIMANWWGKIKMVLQCTAILLLLVALAFGFPWLIPVAQGVMIVALAFAAVAVITYSL